MGKLTTHVLDVYHGQPAHAMTITLSRIAEDNTPTQLLTVETNQDGRCDAPLLADEQLQVGEYELLFDVRAYFEAQDCASPFLNCVPIRFTVFDAEAHYHVPLLVSPWAYNTYRGS